MSSGAATAITLLARIDSVSCERRDSSAADLKLSVSVAQASENISFATASAVPCDTPAELNDVYTLVECIAGADKPINGEAWNDSSIDNICAVLEAVKGSKEAFAAEPFIMLAACPVPPRKWESRVIDTTLIAIEWGIPVYICPSPIMGISAPVTTAGGILMHTVEALSYLTFVQTAKPGAKVFYGGICGTLDMRTTYSTQSAVEACLCVAGFATMAHYYGIPALAFLAQTDSKMPDYQGGFETAMGALTSTLAGVDVILGAGTIDSYSATCTEKLAMDADLFGYLNFYSKGIVVDDDTLALDEIEEVGCGDGITFLEQPHTVMNFREAQYMPGDIVDRLAYGKLPLESLDIASRAAGVISDAKAQAADVEREVGKRAKACLKGLADASGLSFGDLL